MIFFAMLRNAVVGRLRRLRGSPSMILFCVLTMASSAVSAATDTAPGRRNQQIMSAYAGATLLWGYNAWWQDADKTSFHFTNEGWFGADTYRGGADKIGHLYFHYTSQRLLDGAFRWAGNDRRTAARLAAQVVGVTSVLIEITDGFTEEYGFSYEDLLIDFAGIGMGYLVDKHPALDNKLDFRLFLSTLAGCLAARFARCVPGLQRADLPVRSEAERLSPIQCQSRSTVSGDFRRIRHHGLPAGTRPTRSIHYSASICQ